MVDQPSPAAAEPVPPAPVHDHARDYAALRSGVQAAFDASAGPLFRTDADGLYEVYLAALPSDRQSHVCTECRHFVRRFGGLIRVADDGSPVPAMWRLNAVPDFYAAAIAVLHAKVKQARIVRPFLTNQAVLGRPKTGEWEHFAVSNAAIFRHALAKPAEAAAAKLEDFRTVSAALTDFTAPVVDEALRLLKADHLHRAERFVAPVEWLRSLHLRPKGRAGENLMWRAIATAPDGFCHPRASVIGTLLQDIAAGLEFDAVKARFDAKVAPLAYQRPTAAPSAGNIAAAEAIFEKLGLAPSLERRFARLEECVTIWTPAATTPGAGVFGHLVPKRRSPAPELDLPELTLTWTKFVATVLPAADSIQMLVPSRGNFAALLAAANPDAPPILKWDRQDQRNAVSWYLYTGGSDAAQWRLSADWTEVTAVVPAPATWGEDPKAYLGTGAVLILANALDNRTDSGNALFPEFMRGELHAVRSVIEAHSRTALIGGRDEASACGFYVTSGPIGIILRAVTAGKTQVYTIDRWD